MSPERRIKLIITQFAFAGTSLATLVALFSNVSWFAELFSHFRLYYLLIQALLVLTFLHSRNHIALIATLLLAAPNAWYVGPYLPALIAHPTEAAAAGSSVSITAVNLNFLNDDYAGARSYIKAAAPDVLILQEYTHLWDAELDELRSVYPFHIIHARDGVFGMAVYSRLPLRDSHILDLGPAEVVNIRTRVELERENIVLYALHLFPPTSREWAGLRNIQLVNLAAKAQREEGALIVVGDLNLTPYSPLFDRLLADSGLRDARKPQGLHVTWPTFPLPLWIPIDHCLTNENVRVTDVRRGPDAGSDHYPLEITVAAGK